MTSARPGPPDPWTRLQGVASPASRIGHHADALEQIHAHAAPRWLTDLVLPAGWRPAFVDAESFAPTRAAVRVPAPTAGGFGFEAVDLYRLTGQPAAEVITGHADCALRSLAATDITSRVLATQSGSGLVAACASGHFATNGLPMWAQYCTYVAGSTSPGQGLLLEHSLFVDSRWLTALARDVVALSRAVHNAVCQLVAA